MSGVDYLVKNDSFEEDVEGLVLHVFKDKENYMKLINIISTVYKRLDDLIIDMAEKRMLYYAEGQQLTEIASQQGIVRTTDNDSILRSAILIAGIRKLSSGTRDEVVDAILKSIGATPKVYQGLYKMVDLSIPSECVTSQELAQEFVKLLPVNTNYRIVQIDNNPFCFEDDDDGGGFDSFYVPDPTAGSLASMITEVQRPVVPPELQPYVVFGYVDSTYFE